MDKKVLINQPLKSSSKIRSFYGATDDNTSENSTEESCELNDLGHSNGLKYHRTSLLNSTINDETENEDEDDSTGCRIKLYQLNINVKKLLIKYWIWLIAMTLMAMSITGNKVVIFRIFYMFLFLGFLLTFQLSYNLWRRFLLPFLITVMIYSTFVLLALYTYQFSTIRPLWKQYLYLDEKWQKDLGLELFPEAWPLFKELVKPAIFIIITLIHLKSFHKDFMELTRLDDGHNTSSSRISETGTRRTTLPTLVEESDNVHSSAANVQRRVSSAVHRSVSSEGTSTAATTATSSSQRSEGRKRKSHANDALPVISTGKLETLINMSDGSIALDNAADVDQPPQPQRFNNQISPPVSPSQRSISFSLNDGRLNHPLSSSNVAKSHSNILRSMSHRSTISGESVTMSPSKLHRRKTIVDMTQGKPLANNLKTAATDIRDRATSLWDSAKPGINELYEVIWRLVELHMMKFIYLTTFAIAISEITAVNFIYVVASSIALPLGRYEKLVTIIFSIWSVVLILSKMLYQLSVADYFKTDYNCSTVYFAPTDANNSEVYDYIPFNRSDLLDYRNYLGFIQVDDIFIYIGKYLIILLILTINSVITLRQEISRKRFGVDTNEDKVLFFTIERKDADKNFVSLTKFLFNYGFYKFGLEICILSMIILIGNRMDLLSLIYSICVMCCSLLRRATVCKLWPFLTIAIMISIPVQYLLSLGIPSILCTEYPWYNLIDPQIRLWLYLPDYRYPPPGYLIMYDFVVLLLTSRQWIVFRLESNSEITAKAGSNVESYYCPPELRTIHTTNSATMRNRDDLLDFFTFQKSFLDRIKSWFFTCFYWITLYIVFYTAYGRTNLFGLGYILGCFFFLWNGSEFYLKPINKIVRAWKFMIAYCASVIALKTMLHVIGCVLSSVLFNKFCWVAKLLGISCSSKLCRSGYDIREETLINQNCTFTDTTSGLLLDGVCFVFLLIQKRIFGSFYFTYLVKEIKAQQVLASRGAELIHEIQAKEVMEQEEAEKDVMEKIKMKMDRIRAYQQSIKAGDKSRLPPERKSHRQEVSDFGGISPYSTAEDASFRGHSPAAGGDDSASLLPSTLPTVYSPTPSLPTILSPSSAASAAYGKGYLEIDRLPNIRHIDDLCSSPPTMPSMSFASSPILEGDETSSLRHQFNFISTASNPPREATIDPSHAIMSRSSFKLHQKPLAPLTRLHSIIRKQSTHSTAASHGSVRSGDYYLFDDPETEDAEIDFEEKPRKSLIPDPEGEELRRIANLRGISAFMNQLLKGELDPEPIDPPLGADEYDLDIGESSKDSAIISIDREKMIHVDADESMETLITTIAQDNPKPSTSSASDDATGKETSLRKLSRRSSHRKSIPRSGKGALDDSVPLRRREFEEVASSHNQQPGDDEEDKLLQQQLQQHSTAQTQLSLWVRVIHWLTLFYWFIESCIISATAKLNNVSRDYRYVSRRLEVEKRALKALFEMEESVGIIHDNDWKRSTLEKISKASVPPRNGSLDSIKKYSKEISLKQQSAKLKHSMELEKLSKQMPPDEVDGESTDVESSTLVSSNAVIRLFRSLWYTALSQSEKVCYATIIFNQMINASPLSLPLPIMVFLWGCMSVPRPSKTFWISLITYTEGVVVAKYIYNFAVWPILDFSRLQPILLPSDDPIKAGQTITQATTADLLLLLVLFFHRMMLKSLGLWDLDDSVDRSIDMKPATGTSSFEKSYNEDSGSTIIPVAPLMQMGKHQPQQHQQQHQTSRLPPVVKRRKALKEASSSDPLPEDNNRTIALANDQMIENLTEETQSNKTSTGQATSSNSCSVTSTFNDVKNEELPRNRVILFISLTSSKINVGLKPIHKFYYRLLHPPFRIRHDLYSYMFLCDFINFFISVMAFNSFGSSTGESITKYFEDNKVPMPFLFMIMAQFISMIIDRSLYLRKNIKLRLYFHIALVFIIHIWLFFSLPSLTERPFQDLGPPKWWYTFKCIYLILSAVQVRGGYPTRILGNTFTKKYSYFNLYLFKAYMLVPFLYDMRLIMDWIWTDTSLELDEWSIMEDIFKNLFQRKCELQFQANFPMFRGFPRQMYTKYLLGGAYLAMIIAAIWFPLVLFAVGGRVGTPNRPIDVVVEMEISGYVPLAKLTATKVNETYLSLDQFELLRNAYGSKKEATTFLDSYYAEDTTMVKLNGNSTPVWGISPPSKEALINDLKSSSAMDFRISWKISRHKASKGQVMDLEVAKTYYTHLTSETRAKLVSVLEDNDRQVNSVTIPRIFPNFLRVPEKSEPEIIPQLQREDDGYRNISLILKQNGTTQWFEVKDICTHENDPYVAFYRTRAFDCDYILLMLINERVFPGALQVVSGYGILGLYTTFVFVVSRLIRSLFDDVSFKVIYTQMPNVDKVLQLCLDIYLVRESREFTLEEDLYAKLLFLYRSPETLIKWTKQLEEDQFDKQNIPSQLRDQ